jgi:hypothetical protein
MALVIEDGALATDEIFVFNAIELCLIVWVLVTSDVNES